jgi:hypothetical protein
MRDEESERTRKSMAKEPRDRGKKLGHENYTRRKISDVEMHNVKMEKNRAAGERTAVKKA